MNQSQVRRLIGRWAASLFSIALLLSMVATPAIAYVAANQIVSSSIKDGEVKTRDLAVGAVRTGRIKNGAVTGAKIRDYSITKEDIHSGSINKYKLTSGSVNTYKIEDGTIKNADVAANAGIADSKIAYSRKTKVLAIAGAAFTPQSDLTKFDKSPAAGTVYAYTTGTQRLFAAVQLPDGAKITKVTMRILDWSSYDTTLELTRSDGQTVSDMASMTSSGTSASIREVTDNTIADAVIDNQAYAYFIRVDLRGEAGAFLTLVKVNVTYETVGP